MLDRTQDHRGPLPSEPGPSRVAPQGTANTPPIEEAHLEDGVLRLTLAGDLGTEVGSSFRSAVQRVREQAGGHDVLVLDLQGLRFIDSFGVESLVQVEADVAAEGGRVVLVPGPPRVHRVFRLLGCEAAFEIAPGEGTRYPRSGVRKGVTRPESPSPPDATPNPGTERAVRPAPPARRTLKEA